MTDGDGMEFRAAAKLLWREFHPDEFEVPSSEVVAMLARAMRIAAKEGMDYEYEGNPTDQDEGLIEVAARIESRIGEK